MHELVHIYVYWSNGGRLDFYHVNDYLSLAASQSVKNAQSYAFYAASQLETSSPRIQDQDGPANSRARCSPRMQDLP